MNSEMVSSESEDSVYSDLDYVFSFTSEFVAILKDGTDSSQLGAIEYV